MLANYLKIAWRQIIRDRSTSFINIFGLSLAMTVALLIGLHIQQQLSFDQYKTSDAIFRVYRLWGEGNEWVHSPGELSVKIAAELPEVKAATHITSTQEFLFSAAGKSVYADQSLVVDSQFFHTLPMPFKFGNIEEAMVPPNAVVLSEKMAELFFGTSNPVGEELQYNGNSPLIVTGVIAENWSSHLSKDAYVKQQFPNNGWLANGYATYLRLYPKSDLELVKNKIHKVSRPHLESAFQSFGYETDEGNFPPFGLQPIDQVHLQSSSFNWSDPPDGNIQHLYTLGTIALLLLSIAIFNYTNLATAKSTLRAKEIGVRKVTGARRRQLVIQVLVESIFQAFIALLLACILAFLFAPIFTEIFQTTFQIEAAFFWHSLGIASLISLIVGVCSGAYPAIVLSGFQPVEVFQKSNTRSTSPFNFRQGLVVLQFTAVITMLVVLGFMIQQVSYMMNYDLGFDSEQVIVIPHNDWNTGSRIQDLKPAFQAIETVESLACSSQVPGQELGDWSVMYKETGEMKTVSTDVLYADDAILETWKLALLDGRFYSSKKGLDTLNFVVNEAFLRTYNIDDPFTTPIKLFADSIYRSIVGVVQDFHFQSLDKAIGPVVITGLPTYNQTSIRLQTQELGQTLDKIENLWASVEPNHPMRYDFLDRTFAQQYLQQKRFQRGLAYATGITIFIAMLGLFGLATFAIQRRRKEIGIRKVLGATALQVVSLLNRNFIQLVLVAVVIAIPLGGYLANQWLQNFPYRIQMSCWIFLLAGGSSLTIALFAVSVQSIRAALVNPVKSIREE